MPADPRAVRRVLQRSALTIAVLASAVLTAHTSDLRPEYAFPVQVRGGRLLDDSGRTWHALGRSEFALAWHGYHGRWKEVDALLERDAAAGFTYVRVFGMLSWLRPVWEPWSDPARYWNAWNELARRAAARNLAIWFTIFADWNRLEGVSTERFVQIARDAAGYASRHPNVILEVANESYINGLTPEQVREGGRLIRQAGYTRILAGSTPLRATVAPAAWSPDEDARAFGSAPFDVITLHTPRTHGDAGWEHVKEERDAIAAAETLQRPIVLGEPMGFNSFVDPGRYDDSPTRALGAMLVAWISGAAGYCYHAHGGLWSVAEPYPGEGRMRLFWTLPVPKDRARWQFVNGHWPEAPVTSATGFVGDNGFERGPYRLYGMKNDDGEYFAVAFGSRLPWTLKAQRAVDLVRYDEFGSALDRTPLRLDAGETLTEEYRELLILAGRLR